MVLGSASESASTFPVGSMTVARAPAAWPSWAVMSARECCRSASTRWANIKVFCLRLRSICSRRVRSQTLCTANCSVIAVTPITSRNTNINLKKMRLLNARPQSGSRPPVPSSSNAGSLDRALALGDAALDLLARVGTRVTFDHHHVLHQDLARLAIHREHTALLALVTAGNHLDRVFLLDIDPHWLGQFPFCDCHQITSGASETIFMNFLSRSSLATGPNTRVPTGSPTSLINTAALESKRMYVPSLRRVSLRIRTITQRTTLPFLTAEAGAASFTAAVTTSPNPARRPRSPPRGRMQESLRAPLLSATSRIVRIPIIKFVSARDRPGGLSYLPTPSRPDPSAARPPAAPAARCPSAAGSGREEI